MGWIIQVANVILVADRAFGAQLEKAVEEVVRSVAGDIGVELLRFGSGVPEVVKDFFRTAEFGMVVSVAASVEGISNVSAAEAGANIKAGMSAMTTSGSYKELLKVINLKTAIKVHKVAMLVSKDYRETMRGVYREISQYSEALELGSTFITSALENARSVVLEASSAIGRSYDIGQLTWMAELSNWSKKASKLGTRYKNNPGRVIEDIDKWITKPHTDNKAGITRGLFSTIDNVVGHVEKTVNDIVKVRNSVDKFVHDLPESLRKEIEPKIRKVTKEFDSFISTKYKPAMRTVNGIIDILDGDVKKQKRGLSDIISRLRLPGDYITEIDKLSYYQRIEQKFKIATTIGEADIIAGEEINKSVDPVSMELARIYDLIDLHPTPPAWDVGEKLSPVRKEISIIDKRYTWFIGDY